MKFAAIGDIHSNIEALEAVLQDIDNRQVDFIVSTGDLVGYFPYPNEVIDLLRKRHILSIQGNYDSAIGNNEAVCGCDYTDDKQLEMAGLSMLYTNSVISEENRQYLKNLPRFITLTMEGMKALIVHGSPRRTNEYLFEDCPATAEVAAQLSEDILICGHTHKPYYKVVQGKHIINVGSAGKPKHGNPNSTYVIVTVQDEQVQVDIVEVPYDYEKVAQAVEADELLPNEFADLLRKG